MLCILMGIFAVLLLTVSYVVFRIAICSKGRRFNLKKDEPAEKSKTLSELQYQWFNQTQKVSVHSKDNLLLTGYEISRPGDKWVIVAHGYSGSVVNMLTYIDWFYKHDYNVLAINLRGHGTSQGKYYGLGLLDGDDISVWAKYISDRYPNSRTTLFGISMGAASCLTAAANHSCLCTNVISDSAPSSFCAMFMRILCHKMGKLGCLIVPILSMWTMLFAGYSLYAASTEKIVSRITCPVLYIHGASDGFVPPEMMRLLYDKTCSRKKMLLIDGAEHTHAVDVNPDNYWNCINDFLHSMEG